MMKLTTDDYFETSDLPLAAALTYFGFILDSLDKTNPSKANFIFCGPEDLDKAIQQFWAKQLQVEPWGYFNCIKALKARIYSSE